MTHIRYEVIVTDKATGKVRKCMVRDTDPQRAITRAVREDAARGLAKHMIDYRAISMTPEAIEIRA